MNGICLISLPNDLNLLEVIWIPVDSSKELSTGIHN